MATTNINKEPSGFSISRTREVNYRSDFDLFLRLYLCKTEKKGLTSTTIKEELPFPDYDWEARFWTWSKANSYTVSCIGGVCTNCYNDNGKIHVVFNNHRLTPGTLQVEFTAHLPNEIYPDGERRTVVPGPLGVKLIKEATAVCVSPSTIEAQMVLPFYKGDKGDKMTYSDLTEEDKADLSPITAVPTGQHLEAIEPGLVMTALRKTPQALTDAEQAQVKENIGIVEIKVFNDLVRSLGVNVNDDGTYGLNGLTLTYQEMVDVYNAGQPAANYQSFFSGREKIRTHLWPRYPVVTKGESVFFRCHNIEVINAVNLVTSQASFMQCYKARKITCHAPNSSNSESYGGAFSMCYDLEDLVVTMVDKYSFSLASSSKLSLASLQGIVDKYRQDSPITITVHPDVYAKLTGDTTNAGAAALSPEELQQWMALPELAAQKNITFTTA